MKRPISFSVEKTMPGTRARAGIISTPHGDIQTPAFIGVATKATTKGLASLDYKDMGLQAIIANAYHLYLTPGEKIVEQFGGVAKFMAWDGPTMTDSGGFQVFSLGVGFGKTVSKFRAEDAPRESGVAVYDEDIATEHGKLAIVDDEGVSFTSHHDGSLHRFTPERSVEIQHALGADIFFAFDECTAPDEPYEYQREAMERTHRWAKRSLTAHRHNIDANMKQAIYGIAQGGQFDDLRLESAKEIAGMGFDGFGLGGSFSRKYGDNSLRSALDMLTELPPEMPVHGLGVGEPEDILLGIEFGVDTFDCVTPTRNGRNGTVYTSAGKMGVERAEHATSSQPLDPLCACRVCATYTRGYIHHLFRSKEMLGLVLASMHNMFFLTNLAAQARVAIVEGRFESFRDEFLARYKAGTRG
ncbi:MAG: tRNA guanosine(34) transglycosylase Tgt [Candidatus Pacebacteria bacterium]|nr:tRNA guanosine(34) transglycosylase Tgt [Candidatus Paceibacterota bacterium]